MRVTLLGGAIRAAMTGSTLALSCLALVSACLSFGVVSAAQADAYNWEWNNGSSHGVGTLTDNGAPVGTGFTIDTFTGTFSCLGNACNANPANFPFTQITTVTLLAPGGFVAQTGHLSNDNVLYPNADAAGGALIDGAGLGLITSSGFTFQIYNDVSPTLLARDLHS
jgi:hypothetical protein